MTCASSLRPSSALVATLVAVTLGASPTRAFAQPGPQAGGRAAESDARQNRAKELWREGQARYNIEQHDEAIDYFIKAYEIYPFPDILFNLAQAYRRKDDLERARFYFLSYLREAPADASDRAEVEGYVLELEALIAEAKQAGAAKAAAPGPAPADRSAAPAPTAAPWHADALGWTLAGLGAVGVGVGTWALVDAASIEREADGLEEILAGPLYERADDRRLLGLVVGSAGVALLAAGIVKLALTDGAPAPVVTWVPGGASLGFAWSF